VLDDIMHWWLFGPAGAGKSAIAKRIAEIDRSLWLLQIVIVLLQR